ncbi:hypothetical protein AB0I68_22110 [Streptomyces sp. NPDC050448]|uniref:hypothetical protein n=1 Tax=Streptomyces sp. NPDC050448 TaxID=3155404 RepID=UPI003421BA78
MLLDVLLDGGLRGSASGGREVRDVDRPDTSRPEASSLNTRPGDTVPNHVTTPVADGGVAISNSWGGSTHVITDLLGWFTQP